jgi:ABC-2 type transport system ATP-binding protein
MITTRDLTKRFGKVQAVSGLTWNVPRGSIYGLLGPNGAGKSTTLRMLLGIVHPNNGEGSVAGLDIRRDSVAIRKLTAYIPDQKAIHPDMRVEDFVRFYGSFFPDWSAELAFGRLQSWRLPLRQRMKKLSKGMQSKVLLAGAIARKPQLLLLDEPTEGLDPESTEEILSFLTGLAASGDHSIVISSHRLDEIERICDHVGFIQSGHLQLSGELDDLRASCKTIDVDGAVPADDVRKWSEVHSASAIGATLRVVTQSEPATVMERLAGFRPRNIAVHDLNLREIYLAFCGHSKEVLS